MNYCKSGPYAFKLLIAAMVAYSVAGQSAPVSAGFVYSESFSTDSASFPGLYPDWTFSSKFNDGTNGARTASVTGGQLVFAGSSGNSGSVYDRATVTSAGLLGTADFGTSVKVEVELGGGNAASGSWNVGIILGDIQFIFHPGFSGGSSNPPGSFRTVRDSTLGILIPNESTGFTPSADVLHQMSVKADLNLSGDYDISVSLKDANSASVFSKSFSISAMNMGPLNRAGVIRAGQQGGDGFFDNFSITGNVTPVPEPCTLLSFSMISSIGLICSKRRRNGLKS